MRGKGIQCYTVLGYIEKMKWGELGPEKQRVEEMECMDRVN